MDYIGFNITEQLEPTNKDINISFNPDTNYSSYKITIIKDNEIYKEITMINNIPTSFTLSETGIYKINTLYYDTFMNETIIEGGTYIIDKEAPIIKVNKNYYEIHLGKKINIMENVIATDNIDKNITSSIKTNKDELNFNTKGTKKLIYTVSDKAGNTTEKEVLINITNSATSMYILQIIFMTILAFIALGILVYNKSIRLEKRISKFSINPLKDETTSLFDNVIQKISKLNGELNKILYKSEFIKKYSKKYTKYIRTNNQINKTSMDFISTKVLCSILSVIIAIFAKTIKFKIFNIYDIYIPLVFGFFLPDFIYYYKYKTYRKKLENDLLQAIIIMNNAFKSGRSITQAITLVSNELEGPMAEEFKKMNLELSFGLGMDVVFNRLYERIRIEEIAYLTASLTILNQTGGNIVEVFNSIEKSLFNKKKLRLELKSLTSGSRMIVNVLMIVPIAFILLIWVINPIYFQPLLTSKLGIILIGVVFTYYILYIIVIRKLLKVKI
ncbi:MAG: type II secretion system F family protein [Bacilli bacterium]